MKIVHLITGLTVGGAETLLYNRLARFNTDRNDHYVVYFHEGPIAQKIRERGFKTFRIRGFISPYDFIGLIKLVIKMRMIRPDLIHSYLWSAHILGRLLSLLFRIPIICDIHSDVSHHGQFRNAIDQLTAKIPKKYIAVSFSVKKSFERNIIPSKKIGVIHNGIDVKFLNHAAQAQPLSRETLGFSDEDFVIGTVGRLYPIKSHSVLIESFSCFKKEVPCARLCIVGDGPERKNLEDLVLALNISRDVVFIGQKECVAPYYSLFDCFALTSSSEGLSVALLEALCFGLPVVVTHESGSRHDVVEHGVNGFVVPVGDRGKIVHFLKKLYTHPRMLQLIGVKNKHKANVHFNINSMIDSYEALYKTFDKSK